MTIIKLLVPLIILTVMSCDKDDTKTRDEGDFSIEKAGSSQHNN